MAIAALVRVSIPRLKSNPNSPRYGSYIFCDSAPDQELRVQNRGSVAKTSIAAPIEVEGSIFLLLAAGAFFALETLFHYESFLHEITLKSVAPEALDLIIGSTIISLTYFWLGYSCWKNSTDPESFTMAMFVCGFLIFSYFVVEITASASPGFYYATYLDYAQFVSGYGSVTIFVEMLVLFFSYRADKLLRSSSPH